MRAFDFIMSLIGLIVLSPIMLLLAFLIRRDKSGPALFKQQRLGKDAVPFTCIKFRTMYVGTRHVPTHQASQSSITPIGAILRKTKLDELPQLFNVLKGEMAFVGPRPGLPNHTELTEARTRTGALKIRPGITGIAQIQSVDMSTPEKLAEIDGNYAKTRTFLGDILIIIRTFTSILSSKEIAT